MKPVKNGTTRNLVLFGMISTLLLTMYGTFNYFMPQASDTGALSACFPANTDIWTENGLVKISAIAEGDLVLSYNTENGSLVFMPVSDTFIHTFSGEMVTIITDCGRITATDNHPFLARSQDADTHTWQPAGTLSIGDALLNSVCQECLITGVALETVECLVYNIAVTGTHTYLTGDAGYVVHNCSQ